MSRQRNKKRSGRKLGCGLLAVALTFMLGCSADNIMGPGSVSKPADGSYDGGSHFSIIPDPQGKMSASVHGVSLVRGASTLVSAKKGGTVSLGRFTVEIPPGALDADTDITISVPDPSMVVCELEPHGIQFKKPVTLTIDYSGTIAEGMESSSTLGLYWYNDETGRWQLVGKGLDEDRNETQAKLEHFSGYGMGWE